MVNSMINALLLADLFVLVVLLTQLLLSLRRYRILPQELGRIDRLEDTPTVSLCIPARNETHALADCLTSAVLSDYPKLEIIVLDDCSHDQTSQIIRSFAHDGVRFVKGTTPSEGWLGKNNAYQTLVEQAKGEYIVFMSVDTRVQAESISQLIAYMRQEKLSMLSVLPRRFDDLRASVIFAPLRYFWQIATPLKFNTPMATSLWAIRADSLSDIGGMQVDKDKVDIENRLAARLDSLEEYHFLIANDLLQVSYAKHWKSQADTAIRLWYPTLQKSYLRALGVILAHTILFIVPPLVLAGGYVAISSSNGYINPAWVLALMACLLSGYIYISYFRAIKRLKTALDIFVVFASFFVVPILALQEAMLVGASFYQYKRGKVDWKGRNICYPVTKRY